MPPAADLTEREGLRLFTLEAALTKVPESFFVRYPVEAQVVLSGTRDASDVALTSFLMVAIPPSPADSRVPIGESVGPVRPAKLSAP